MSRSWKIGTGGLLVVGLVVGCQHTEQQTQCQESTTCAGTAPAGATPATPTPQQRLSLVPSPAPLAPATPPALVPVTPDPIAARPTVRTDAPRTLPPVAAAPVNPEQSAPPTPKPSPWVMPKVETTTPAPEPAPIPTANSPTAAAAPAPVPAAATPVVSTLAANPSAPAPQYFNSPDYSILFGVLDYNPRSGAWRLRYADAGDEDRYGGSVTLDGVGRQMQGYTSGQFVRVEGNMVDPESHDASPAYRVKDMRPGTGGK